MPEFLRALLFVYLAALPAIFLAERYSRPFVPRQEFLMWAGAWIATMGVAFVSRNFMIFSVFLVLLSIYCHRQPHRPIYLYIVLLFAAPAVDVFAGLGPFGNKLIDFNPARVLAMFFLAPTAFKLLRETKGTTVADKLVICYVLLLVLLSFRLGKTTEVLRVVVVTSLDILLPYFVFSRLLTGSEEIKKAFCAFVIALLPIAAVSLIEAVKVWRLFQTVETGWGAYILTPYLFRSGLLRAAATCVQPISLGFACMAAIGCLLSAGKPRLADKPTMLALGLILLSLCATVSRGPWMGSIALVGVALLFQRRAVTNMARAAIALAAFLPIILMSPFGQKVLALMPFIGKEGDTEDYRVNLFDASLTVIGRNPLFGSPDYLRAPEMRALIQGEGIVDIVNSYLAIALSYGLVTLAVFCSILAVLIISLVRLSFSSKGADWNASAVLGTLVAIAITIATVSSVYVIPYIYWTFMGLAAGVLRCASLQRQPLPRTTTQPERQMKVLGQW